MIFCGEKGGAPAAKGRGNLRAFRQSGEGAGESDAGGGKSGSGEETGKDACLEYVPPAENPSGKYYAVRRPVDRGKIPYARGKRKVFKSDVGADRKILENAVKYSPKGSRVVSDCQTYDMYSVVQIKDEGIGIPR